MKTPALPALSSKVDPEVRKSLDALKGWFAKVGALTSIDDLVNTGVADPDGSGGTKKKLPVTDDTVPPILHNFSATGAFNSIILEWDDPDWSDRLSYIEVRRAEVDDFGLARKVGSTVANVYTDTPPDNDTAKTYYYWACIVSKAGIVGPWAGSVSGSTANNPNYLLELLDGQLTESHLYQTLLDKVDAIPDLITRMGVAEGDIASTTNQLADLIISEFDAANSYTLDQKVKYDGNVYNCILATTAPSPDPTDDTYWALVGTYAGDVAQQVAADALAASGSATAAAGSATLALGYRDAAGDYALAASASATAASTSESNASTYEYNASAAATDARGYAEAAAVDYNSVKARLDNAGGTGVTVEESLTATASEIDGLQGQYTIKVNANGYVAGFGLAVSNNNANPSSEFIIVADRFTIAPVATNPSGGGSPFYYLTNPTTVNGVTVPAGCYIKSAFIAEATIYTGHIRNAAIDSAKIAALAVETGHIANLAVTSAKIANANITTAKIADAAITNAKIGSAEVGTLKIAGNAVTIPQVWRVPGPRAFNPNVTANVIVAKLSLPTDISDAEGVLFAVSMYWTTTTGGNYNVTARILKGTTELGKALTPVANNVLGGNLSFQGFDDAPVAGDNFYFVEVSVTNTYLNLYAVTLTASAALR